MKTSSLFAAVALSSATLFLGCGGPTNKCTNVRCQANAVCDVATGRCVGTGGTAGGDATGGGGSTGGGSAGGGSTGGGSTGGGSTGGGSTGGGSTGGGSTGGGSTGGGSTGGGFANPVSADIAAVRAADAGTVSLSVTGALVTYVKPAVGSDPAGFFVQGEQLGPAVFVAVDPTTLNPVPAVGDMVSFTATAVADAASMRHVTALSAFSRLSAGNAVSALAQDVSAAADVVSNLGSYESESLLVTLGVDGGFISSGTAHVAAAVATAGVPASSNLRLRLPATLQDTLDLSIGCVVNIKRTPLWRFGPTAQISAWSPADVTIASCPGPTVVAAGATDSTHIVVSFDRRPAANSVSVDGSQFTFTGGLTAVGAAVSGRTVTVTTAAQTPGASYTLTVANTVTDERSTPMGTPRSANFVGFAPQAKLIINEVNAAITGSKDLVELLAVQGGSIGHYQLEASGTTAPLATFPSISVAQGDLLVVHLTPGLSDGGVDSETETLAKNQFSSAVASANYDQAWDVRGNGQISYSWQVVRLRDRNTNALLHGVPFGGASTAPVSFLPALYELQDAGLWLPPTCSAMTCSTDGGPSDALAISVDWSGSSTLVSGRSVRRLPGTNSNTRADWANDAGSSWGAMNP